MPFTLTEAHLSLLFRASNFTLPTSGMVFVGLRGCTPIDVSGTGFAGSQQLEYLGVDYMHPRCTLVQWRPGSGFAVFPGSTVPYIDAIRSHIAQGGAGTNQLAFGYFRGDQGFYKGNHSQSDPNRTHRAFRSDAIRPVWRTGDDADYDGDDRLETSFDAPGPQYDNLHCAWQTNASAASYSSVGCQVVIGRPRVLARGWTEELGPWAKFIENGYSAPQQRFNYALFSGREALAVAAADDPADRFQTVRFGSDGELVETVQDALIKHGYNLGSAGADGDCGMATIVAIKAFQHQQFGKDVDLIVGQMTATALGLAWPKIGGATPPLIDRATAVTGPTEPVLMAVSAGPDAAPAPAAPNYRSLTPGGFFSSNPLDLSVKRSIRTNNPGALNISKWQQNFPGFAGVTIPDSSGNKTAIYVTPEHGIAAWHFLFTDRYGLGANGSIEVRELARKYAGVTSVDAPAAKSYVTGWGKWSGNKLSATTRVAFDSDADMLLLARGMFGHEIGGASPLHDDQILNALKLQRDGKLPKA